MLDSNATFKAGIDDGNEAADDTQTCEDQVKAIAHGLYDVMQPR